MYRTSNTRVTSSTLRCPLYRAFRQENDRLSSHASCSLCSFLLNEGIASEITNNLNGSTLAPFCAKHIQMNLGKLNEYSSESYKLKPNINARHYICDIPTQLLFCEMGKLHCSVHKAASVENHQLTQLAWGSCAAHVFPLRRLL
jgi:hypothetical protein